MTRNSIHTPLTASEANGANPQDELTFIAAVLQAVEVDWQQGWQAVPARYLAQQHYPQLEVNLPVLILYFDDADQLARVAQTLGAAYPTQHGVTFAWSTTPNELHTHAATVADMAQWAIAAPHNAIYVPPLPAFHGFSALQEIVAHLRSPAGCPWDRAQTLSSLRHDLLSECAEVLESIDLESSGIDNSAHIAEELGDLFMAATLMVQVAIDAGRFQMADAMYSIVTKLRRRHPHVFDNVTVDDVQDVLINWDAIKAQEKAEKGIIAEHPLAGVPAALPALEKARQIQTKAAKAGLLDRSAVAQANPALAAVVSECDDEYAFGELLWQLVALAQRAGFNPEDALRSYSVRYRAEQGQ